MKIIKCLFIICLLCLTSFNVKADETIYLVSNAEKQSLKEIQSFSNYNEALAFYNENVNAYQNLVLSQDNRIIKMEYGFISFNTDDACTYEININESTINPCFANDALYIASQSNTSEIAYKISNVISYISIDNVRLIPFDSSLIRPSRYVVKDGILYHDIKNQMQQDYYAYHIKLGDIKEYLSDGIYYSYDGHYFYDSYFTMSDDTNNATYNNAINANNPYYNYFQYLSNRTSTNYDVDELTDYFYNDLTIKSKLDTYRDFNHDLANDVVNESEYYGAIESFVEAQNIYGANAMMMLSLSMVESSYGKNYMAYSKNNLFGHVAFDTEYERNNQIYENVLSSIYSHARYIISNRYSNPKTNMYYGSYFGDLSTGMNVKYSKDPYWGEKAASRYLELDEKLGSKDLNSYALGISYNSRINVYNDAGLSSFAYRINNPGISSFVILEDLNGVYKIAKEVGNSDDTYSFSENIGYIDSNNIAKLINSDKITTKEYYNITFELNDGRYHNKQTVVQSVLKGLKPVMNDVKCDGYVLVGFDTEVVSASEDKTYVANYKQIKAIEMAKYPKKRYYEQDSILDLYGAKLRVKYVDDTEEIIDITNEMLSSYDMSNPTSQDIKVNYRGFSTSFKIDVLSSLKENRIFINDNIDKLCNEYATNNTYDRALLSDIITKLGTIEYNLSLNQIRLIDKMLSAYTRELVNFDIDDKNYDLQISGMALALDLKDVANRQKKLFKDTYRITTEALNNEETETLVSIGEAYNLKAQRGFRISFYKNYEMINSKYPFIVQIKLNDLDTNKIYTVYRLDEDGKIYKCQTSQSKDFIQFVTDKEGAFYIYTVDTSNDYLLQNVRENLTAIDDDPFYFEKVLSDSVPFVVGFIDELLLGLYLLLSQRREKLWKDYKKLLLKVESVHVEKLNN